MRRVLLICLIALLFAAVQHAAASSEAPDKNENAQRPGDGSKPDIDELSKVCSPVVPLVAFAMWTVWGSRAIA